MIPSTYISKYILSKNYNLIKCYNSTSSFSNKSSIKPISSLEHTNFLSFCDDQGIKIHPSIYIGERTSIINGKSQVLRGLFSKDKIIPTTYLAAIPYNIIFTKYNFTPDVRVFPILSVKLLSYINNLSKFNIDTNEKSDLRFIKATNLLLENRSLCNMLQLSFMVLITSLQKNSTWNNYIKFAGVPKLLLDDNVNDLLDNSSTEKLEKLIESPMKHACNMTAYDISKIIPNGTKHLFYGEIVKNAKDLQETLRYLSTFHPLVIELIREISRKYLKSDDILAKNLLCDWAFAFVSSRSIGGCFDTIEQANDVGLAFKEPFIVPFLDLINSPNEVTERINTNIEYENLSRTELKSMIHVLKKKEAKLQNKKFKEAKAKRLDEPEITADDERVSNDTIEMFKNFGISRSSLERSNGYMLIKASDYINKDDELLAHYLKAPNNYDGNYAFAFGFAPKGTPIGYVNNL